MTSGVSVKGVYKRERGIGDLYVGVRDDETGEITEIRDTDYETRGYTPPISELNEMPETPSNPPRTEIQDKQNV